MKNFLFISLLFLSNFCVAANSAIFEKLEMSSAPTPLEILKKIENQYINQAVVVEFEIEFEDGDTTYEITLYQASRKQFIELLVNKEGVLLELEYNHPEIDEQEEIAAAELMTKKGFLMQDLVIELDTDANRFLVEAQLEQDMGVTYMVATFVNIKGSHKKAIDLTTGKNLPLLRWGS